MINEIMIFSTGFMCGCGACVAMWSVRSTRKNSNTRINEWPSLPVELLHIRPKYYGYKGGFAGLTKCDDCGGIGLYEDQHPVKPCRSCGGNISIAMSGRWDGTQWVLKKKGGVGRMSKSMIHPLKLRTNIQYTVQTVLRDLASQEGCDGEPYDQMIEAADYIDELEQQLMCPAPPPKRILREDDPAFIPLSICLGAIIVGVIMTIDWSAVFG